MAFIIGKCQLFIPEMCIGVLTTFIQACSLNRKRKAHKITCLYPLEIPDLKPPDAFGIPIVSTPPCLRNSSSKNSPPPCLRNSKKPSVVLYGYFLELPILVFAFLLRGRLRPHLDLHQVAEKRREATCCESRSNDRER